MNKAPGHEGVASDFDNWKAMRKRVEQNLGNSLIVVRKNSQATKSHTARMTEIIIVAGLQLGIYQTALIICLLQSFNSLCPAGE